LKRCQAETGESHAPRVEHPPIDLIKLDEALREVMHMLTSAKRPIVMAGVEVHRFGLQKLLSDFLDRSGLPFATGLLGKSVVSENHPHFVGVYAGTMSPDDIRDAVEEADCVIAVGPLITDLSTGIFTQNIDSEHVVILAPEELYVRHHLYPGIDMKRFLEALIAALPESTEAERPVGRHVLPPFIPEAGREITMERLITCINTFLDENTIVITEAGDPLFGALDIRVHGMNDFLSPAYYASLGFGVPAAVAVQLAAPDRRPLALVGDGSFQMTGMELSTAVRYGLCLIVVVLNNGGYGTFRPMIDGTFNDIRPWQYADIPKVIGAGQGFTVSKEDDLVIALESARKNSLYPTVIDVRIEKYDFSSRLRSLTDRLKKRV